MPDERQAPDGRLNAEALFRPVAGSLMKRLFTNTDVVIHPNLRSRRVGRGGQRKDEGPILCRRHCGSSEETRQRHATNESHVHLAFSLSWSGAGLKSRATLLKTDLDVGRTS